MAVSMLMPTRWSGLHISTSAGGPAGFRLNTRPPAGLPRRAPTREKGEESSLPSQKGLNQHRTPCRAPAPSPNRTLEATGTSQEAPKSLPLLAAIPSDSPSHQPRRSQALGVPQQRDRLDSEPECTGVSRGFSSCVPAPGSGPQGPGTHAFVQGKCFSGSSSPRPRPVPPFASVLTLASLRPCQLDHPPVWLPSPPHTLPPGQVPAPPPPSPQLSGRPGSQIKGPLAPTSVLSHHRGQHCHLQNLPDAL
ncbi:formin-like protein 16 isoform X2 [Leopardus geoffroyi]|uniref:formin-like protein 16 isoform X2 n=1 Tax=Leopardus geoffroyi TaxID=46844 RepID=UPI001E25ECEE|nr:formin-like protein 16 isoform X2 [Leopardus geoffroyi]